MSRDYDATEKLTADDGMIQHELAVAVEAIWNLLYLIDFEAERPEVVRLYARMATKRVDSLMRVARGQNINPPGRPV